MPQATERIPLLLLFSGLLFTERVTVARVTVAYVFASRILKATLTDVYVFLTQIKTFKNIEFWWVLENRSPGSPAPLGSLGLLGPPGGPGAPRRSMEIGVSPWGPRARFAHIYILELRARYRARSSIIITVDHCLSIITSDY